jgi:hypothetical protein
MTPGLRVAPEERNPTACPAIPNWETVTWEVACPWTTWLEAMSLGRGLVVTSKTMIRLLRFGSSIRW